MSKSITVPVPAPVKKVHSALLPLFVSLVVVTYLDRTSLAFAALQLCNSDWFNAQVYGLGSGVFYVSYVLCQIPSNLLLSRLGAKLWLPMITAAFGAVSLCSGLFIKSPASFYALRLALGITEAGVFPGMWHVCGQFYPSAFITVPYSVIEASIAISQILAAPAAAALLQLSGFLGLQGWQWLFLAEGTATLVLAGVLRWRLPSSIATAKFLTHDDRLWLLEQLSGPGSISALPAPAAKATSKVYTLEDDDAVLLVDGNQSSGVCGSSSDSKHNGCNTVASVEGQYQTHTGSRHHTYHHSHSVAAAETAASGSSSPSATAGLTPGHSDSASAAGGVSSRSSSSEPKMTGWQQVKSTFTNKLILYLMVLKALKDIALDGLVYWVPMLVHALLDGDSVSLSVHSKSSGSGEQKHCGGKSSQLHAVLLSSIPFGTAAAAALLLGHSSEKRQERRMHVGLPLLMGGCAFMLLPLLLQLGTHVPAFIAVTAAVVAADATTGPFWSWVHCAAAPGTGAVSLAAVNSVGKAGGFLGPLSFGLILHATGSYVPSILLVGAVLLCGGTMALCYAGERWSRYQKLPTAAHKEQQQELVQLQPS